MNTTARILNILIRITGGATALLGLLFWFAHVPAVIPVHMVLGVTLTLALLALAIVAARGGAPLPLVTIAIVWAVGVPALGMTQVRLLPGSLHWIIRVLHLAVGFAAIRLGGMLTSRMASSTPVDTAGPPSNLLKRLRIFAPLALLIVAGAFGVHAYAGGRRPLGLILSGSIEARDVQVGSLVGGRVTLVQVDEGATVIAGQPLVTLEPDLLDLQIGQQRGTRNQARARLALAIAGPRAEEKERARVDWQNAEADRRRLGDLLADHAVAQRDYDNAAAAAAIKLAQLEELERGTRPEDLASARAAVAEADARLAYLERQRQETVVTAPAAGVVQSLDLRPGDLVAPNQPMLTLLETGQLWVRVYVPEPELGRVHIGQGAALSVDTFKDRSFSGKVVEIRERGEYTPRNIETVDQRSDLVFGVKIAIAPTPELKPGMAARVTLEP
ncbi:MAG TPA: HlyD family efflux transporter periplasmic adaptor subunit [Gemmatimonadales bacterium]|nr:HlyD family efflux transporter periplasmic adaptor subunit [Gemmatimonadales bacterium]